MDKKKKSSVCENLGPFGGVMNFNNVQNAGSSFHFQICLQEISLAKFLDFTWQIGQSRRQEMQLKMVSQLMFHSELESEEMTRVSTSFRLPTP